VTTLVVGGLGSPPFATVVLDEQASESHAPHRATPTPNKLGGFMVRAL